MQKVIRTNEHEVTCPHCSNAFTVRVEQTDTVAGNPLMVAADEERQAVRVLGIHV